MPVYSLDLRNHGTSPHARPHTYDAMAKDVARLMDEQGLEKGVNLMGHSMCVCASEMHWLRRLAS